MEITLSYVSQLKIPGISRGSSSEKPLTIPDSITVDQLMDSLGIIPAHRQYIKPFIGSMEVSRSKELSQGDSLFLFMAAGGG